MNPLETQITDMARDLLVTTILLAGPVLLAGLIVGLAVSLFQALTSVQEQTMSLIPKMVAVMIVTMLLLAPALQILKDFALHIMGQMHSFGLS